jgi:hypothetical protein
MIREVGRCGRGRWCERLAVALVGVAACGVPGAGPTPTAAPRVVPVSPAAPDVREPSPGAERDPEARPVVLVTDPVALAELEALGASAGPIAFGAGNDAVGSFVDRPRWADLRAALTRDVRGYEAADPRAGVGMRHPHRLFDPAWLSSDKMRLELVGVVNRADRRPFDPAHCGETRLVYRLAYRTEIDATEIDSRLPMTVNVVFWQDEPAGCEAAARRWLAPPDLQGAALARWMVADEGPLGPVRAGSMVLKSIEVNAQIVRWPSVVHPTLGGHAEYVLRVFHPRGEGLTPAALENTPDVEALRRDERRRAALLAWIRDPETLAAIEAGVMVMPPAFAATRAVSVTPRGLGRRANRPFSALFQAAAFADLDFSAGEHVRSAEGLLRRLDGASCQGCHEIRSVAGFHLLGEPRDPDALTDTIAIPTSPHLDGDLARREAWVATAARAEVPSPARPLSDFERVAGGYGAHCGLGDPGLDHWTCAEELECVALDDPQMGTCLPRGERTAGDPCEIGRLSSHLDPVRDRVHGAERLPCAGGAVCNSSKVGFPTGMCTTTCTALGPGEACGAIVDLTTFNNCIGRRKPFPRCIEQAAFEAGMRACDRDHRCREDYICARSPSAPDRGVCLPPYFLFQMRVDGHVL